ncbi:MAG: hypothetical protein ACJ76Y_24130 [Thermoanaerobaculia bacterium]
MKVHLLVKPATFNHEARASLRHLALNEKRLAREVFSLAQMGSTVLKPVLLKETIAFARTTKFYRQLWQEIDLDRIDLESLSYLPIVTRSQIRAAGDEARVREGAICNEVFTSGTTGPPLITLRGDKEQEFISSYFSLVAKQHSGSKLRGLKFIDPCHGYHVRVPVPIHFHNVSIYDAGSFDYAREVLSTEHREIGIENRCTILLGGGRCLRAFTLDTANRFGRIDSSLERVVSVGHYLTRRWRNFIEETWGAPIIDCYSLSEIFGGATQSLACGWWHFDESVIPEVVDTQSRHTMTEGIGVLVLTSLFPFQQVQPLVRYMTGDLVEVTHSRSSIPGCLSIRPLGRLSHAVFSRDGRTCLLNPASLVEALDAMPEVARSPLLRDSNQVSDNFIIGLPRFALETVDESNRRAIRICIALGEGFRTEGDRRRLRQKICHQLLDKNLDLTRAVDCGEVTLVITYDDQIAGCDISAPG